MWVALLSLALPASASAQEVTSAPPAEAAHEPADAARDAEGRGLFEAGRAAFTDGRYDDALRYFDRAYALTHRSELLYNIGSANDRLRRDAEALVAFEQYVREVPDAANAREVEARIRVLRESVAMDARDVSPTALPEADSTAVVTEQQETAPAPSDGGPGIVGEWWFWTILVAVAAGAIVTGVVLGTQGGGTVYPPYMTGDNGAFVFTLTLDAP